MDPNIGFQGTKKDSYRLPLPNLNKSSFPKTKNMPFSGNIQKTSSFRHLYVERGYPTTTFDFRKWHNTSYKHLKNWYSGNAYLSNLGRLINWSIGLIWHHCHSRFTLSQLWARSPKIQAHSVLQTQSFYTQFTTKKAINPWCLNSPKL